MRAKILLLVLLVAATSATAADPAVITITVSQFGAPWRVTVAAGATSTRSLRIVSTHKISLTAAVATPFVGAISGEEAAVTLDPSAATIALEANVAKLIPIAFSKFQYAEVYTGAIAFRTTTTPPREIGVAQLHLDARVKPVLAAPPLRSFSRVRAGNDWLARRLLGEEHTRADAEVRVQSSTPRPVQILGADAVIVGQKTEREIGSAILQTPSPRSSNLGVVRIPLTINRENLPPDRYSGSVLIVSGETGDASVAIPVEIAIRAAPLVPLLAVLFGILVGRLVQYMETKGNAQANLILRLERVDKILGPGDHDAVAGDIDHARQQIYLGDLANAETSVAKLEQISRGFRRIDGWIAALRNAGTAKAQQLIVELEELRKSSFDEQRVSGYADTVRTALLEARAATRSRDVAEGRKPARRSIAGWFADTQEAFQRWRAELAPLIAWLLYGVTLIALTYIGVATLYVANPTFGADRGDYIALLLWGLASDVTSKTLTTVGSLMVRR